MLTSVCLYVWTYGYQHGNATEYLVDYNCTAESDVSARQSLRSASRHLLVVPWSRAEHILPTGGGGALKMRDPKMQDRKVGTNDVMSDGPKCGTWKCGTWNTNNEFHIYTCVTDSSTTCGSGAMNIKDYTETVTLAITRAQIVSCLYHDVWCRWNIPKCRGFYTTLHNNFKGRLTAIGPPWREQPWSSYIIKSGYDCRNKYVLLCVHTQPTLSPS